MEARRLAELDAGMEIDACAEWGCSRWAGCGGRGERPRAGEGRSGRVGAVPAARRPCAGERLQRKGIGRCQQGQASRARTGTSVVGGARDEKERAARTGKRGIRTVGLPEESITVK